MNKQTSGLREGMEAVPTSNPSSHSNRSTSPTLIELTEYAPTYLPANALSHEEGEQLWRQYDVNGRKLQIAFPSPKTDNQWQIIPQGWVGHIPFSPTLHLKINPKTALHNIFQMWEYAYRLQNYQVRDALIEVNAPAGFYDRLANMLAVRVLQRGRQGFYQTYLNKSDALPFLRGRMEWKQHHGISTLPAIRCRFDERTPNVTHNQLLAYTLTQIARSTLCRPETQKLVRQACHLFDGMVHKRPFTSTDCLNLTYTRLNEDYRAMHALCRFFLDHSAPTHHQGNHAMLPFLINMARLYELFVAEWLQTHIPAPWHVKAHEVITLGAQNELQFDIDMVLYDGNGRSHAVLDTKYKTSHKASNADINQIITYAKAKNCPHAILIYPTPLQQPLDVQIGNIIGATHLHSLTFSLQDDITTSGNQFLHNLLTSL